MTKTKKSTNWVMPLIVEVIGEKEVKSIKFMNKDIKIPGHIRIKKPLAEKHKTKPTPLIASPKPGGYVVFFRGIEESSCYLGLIKKEDIISFELESEENKENNN